MKHFRDQPDHNYWRTKFTPLENAMVWWGLASVAMALGWVKWQTPSLPPFSGKFAFLQSYVYSQFGAKGLPILWWAISGLCFIAGLFAWKKSE